MKRTFTRFLVILRLSPCQTTVRGLGERDMTLAVLAEVGMVEITNPDTVGVIAAHWFLNNLLMTESLIAQNEQERSGCFISIASSHTLKGMDLLISSRYLSSTALFMHPFP